MDHEVLLSTSRFRVERRQRALADGRTLVREVVVHPGAVVILPLVDRDRVCLLKNYRLAVGETLWELPAGTLEPGEDPAQTAHRELIEETGYRAGAIRPLHQFWMSPGILSEKMHLYLATDLSPGPAEPEWSEELEPSVIAWNDALAMVDRGEIRDAKTLVGLLWWERNRLGSLA